MPDALALLPPYLPTQLTPGAEAAAGATHASGAGVTSGAAARRIMGGAEAAARGVSMDSGGNDSAGLHALSGVGSSAPLPRLVAGVEGQSGGEGADMVIGAHGGNRAGWVGDRRRPSVEGYPGASGGAPAVTHGAAAVTGGPGLPTHPSKGANLSGMGAGLVDGFDSVQGSAGGNPTGSHSSTGSWVEASTLWRNVQRTGQAMQKQESHDAQEFSMEWSGGPGRGGLVRRGKGALRAAAGATRQAGQRLRTQVGSVCGAFSGGRLRVGLGCAMGWYCSGGWS